MGPQQINFNRDFASIKVTIKTHKNKTYKNKE